MTVPYYVNEHQSDIRAIKPGWYGLERNGQLSSGPFLNQGECLTGITQPSSTSSSFRALARMLKPAWRGTPLEGDAP